MPSRYRDDAGDLLVGEFPDVDVDVVLGVLDECLAARPPAPTEDGALMVAVHAISLARARLEAQRTQRS